MFKKFLDFSLHLFFPVSCPVCSKPSEIICDDCLKKLFSEKHSKKIFLPFDWENVAVYSAGVYDGALNKTIIKMKYGGYRVLCKYLGTEAAKIFEIPNVDVLIPVPLHIDSTRNFNQSFELAKSMGKFWGIKVLNAAEWTKIIPHQARIDFSERSKMKVDVFKIKKNISGLRVALVDDVLTTGTTLSRFAQACHNAGAIVECAYTIASI